LLGYQFIIKEYTTQEEMEEMHRARYMGKGIELPYTLQV